MPSSPRIPRRRQTWQRGAVHRVLERAGCHLTAEEIHRRLRRTGRRVGLATVYRALELFVRSGLVEPVHIADGRLRYGLSAKHHDHAICLTCGRWVAMGACLVPRLPRHVPAGFHVTGHQLEVYGFCAECRSGTSAGPAGRQPRPQVSAL
jgi:Fur family ferric uptake transcriptional regulator